MDDENMRKNHSIRHLGKVVACYLIILTLCSTIFPVGAVGQQETATVSGRVVDEDGQGLSDINIKVYSSDGSYIQSMRTYSNGYFFIYGLPLGKYTLHFSESDSKYELSIISVSLTSVGQTDLGDIVLLRALRSSSSALSRVERPGNKVLLPFTISNIGEEPEVVEFLVSKPEGWSTKVLDATGEVTKVYLSSGSSLNFQLETRIPSTSTGNNSITLTSVGKTTSTLSFTITVEPSNDSIISCQFPGKAVEPGGTVVFQVRVKNPFGMETRFSVAVDSVPLNWTTFVKSAGGEAVTEVTLDSGESTDIIVEATPTVTAMIGEYKILVKAESSDVKVITFLPLNIHLTEAEEEIEVAATFLEVTAKAGEVVKYPITIINSGETDTRLFISVVEPPTDWKVAFKSDTVEVSSLYLKAGGSENLIVEVTPPSSVNISSYLVQVQVESADGTSSIRLDLKANIIGSYDLSLAPSTLLTSATVGGATTLTAKLTNMGQTPMTSLKLNVDAPQGWDVFITPAQIESLKPRESYTFTIVVEIPDDTVAGDYLLTLTGLSDQAESDKVQIRVTASASTSWGMAGIGIIAVILGGLIVVFKKFSRR